MIFYKEHDFKEMPSIGIVPKDWETSSIEEIATFKKRCNQDWTFWKSDQEIRYGS